MSEVIQLKLSDEMIRGLRAKGNKNEDLATLATRAIARANLMSMISDIRENVQKSGLSQDELDKIVSDAFAWDKQQRAEKMARS